MSILIEDIHLPKGAFISPRSKVLGDFRVCGSYCIFIDARTGGSFIENDWYSSGPSSVYIAHKPFNHSLDGLSLRRFWGTPFIGHCKQIEFYNVLKNDERNGPHTSPATMVTYMATFNRRGARSFRSGFSYERKIKNR